MENLKITVYEVGALTQYSDIRSLFYSFCLGEWVYPHLNRR